jgi:hypothetical protein
MVHPDTLWHSLYTLPPVHAWVAETPAPWHRTVPEKLVRCLWFDQRWRPSALRTLDGRDLIVHSPGRWNLQAGPDFHQASIEFVGGARHRGDVEIHRYASGWTAHRHHLDARYNGVILHVFLWPDRPTVEVQRADGQLIPQVALAPYLSRPLAAYQADISLEEYPYKTGQAHGRCYETLQRLAPQAVCDVLNRAGDTRLQQRVWRWSERESAVGLEQAMYEAVLRALGATGYRQHFQALARCVPWSDLRRCLHGIPPPDSGLAAEALLLGMAGMVSPSKPASAALDAETRQYIESLHEYWQRFPADIQQRAWYDVDWRQPHGRPTNTPQRRLAGMARLLAHYHGTSLLDAAVALCRTHSSGIDARAARALGHALARLLDVPALSYWSRRAYLGGRLSQVQRLIGGQRASTVVIDAMLPILLVYAQRTADVALSERVLACYHTAPRLPDNHLLRYMRHRLLGNDPALLVHVTGARQQQGLLQLFTDFCGNDEGNCQGCDFLLQQTT